MRNLAGIHPRYVDEQILDELLEAGIRFQEVDRHKGEVCYGFVGRMGEFDFRRAWCYWVVAGLVPMAVAEELYGDPLGSEIRATGFAGGILPSEVAKWFTPSGAQVLPVAEEAEFHRLAEKHELMRPILRTVIFSDDPQSHGAQQFVDSYHIDTQEGLKLFADRLRAHSLVPI